MCISKVQTTLYYALLLLSLAKAATAYTTPPVSERTYPAAAELNNPSTEVSPPLTATPSNTNELIATVDMLRTFPRRLVATGDVQFTNANVKTANVRDKKDPSSK